MALKYTGGRQQGQMGRRNFSFFLLLLLLPQRCCLPICHIRNHTPGPFLQNLLRRSDVCLQYMAGIEILSGFSHGGRFQKQLRLTKIHHILRRRILHILHILVERRKTFHFYIADIVLLDGTSKGQRKGSLSFLKALQHGLMYQLRRHAGGYASVGTGQRYILPNVIILASILEGRHFPVPLLYPKFPKHILPLHIGLSLPFAKFAVGPSDGVRRA